MLSTVILLHWQTITKDPLTISNIFWGEGQSHVTISATFRGESSHKIPKNMSVDYNGILSSFSLNSDGFESNAERIMMPF